MSRPKFTAKKDRNNRSIQVRESCLVSVEGSLWDGAERNIQIDEAHGINAFARGIGNAKYTQEIKFQCVEVYLRGEGATTKS